MLQVLTVHSKNIPILTQWLSVVCWAILCISWHQRSMRWATHCKKYFFFFFCFLCISAVSQDQEVFLPNLWLYFGNWNYIGNIENTAICSSLCVHSFFQKNFSHCWVEAEPGSLWNPLALPIFNIILNKSDGSIIIIYHICIVHIFCQSLSCIALLQPPSTLYQQAKN